MADVNYVVEYRPTIISLVAAVAFIGAYASAAGVEQYRIERSQNNLWSKWLLLVSLCFGGVCIWGTFYVAMSSYRLHNPYTNAITLKNYHPAKTTGSLVFVTLLSMAGMYIASSDKYFNRPKKFVAKDFEHAAQEVITASFGVLPSSWVINWTACTRGTHRLWFGSLLSAGASVLMRYQGMASTNIPGTIQITHGSIVAHAIISIVGYGFFYWSFFRLLSLYPSQDALRTVCVIVFVAFLTGMQYVALSGVTFTYSATKQLPSDANSLTSAHLIVGVFISVFLAAFFMLVYVLSDLRRSLQQTNSQLRQADRALLALLHRQPAERAAVQTTVTPGGTTHHFTTAVQRHTQAPPEVVNYSRQYLEAVATRGAGQQHEIFTYKHRFYHDVEPENVVARAEETKLSEDPLLPPNVEPAGQDHRDSNAGQNPHQHHHNHHAPLVLESIPSTPHNGRASGANLETATVVAAGGVDVDERRIKPS